MGSARSGFSAPAILLRPLSKERWPARHAQCYATRSRKWVREFIVSMFRRRLATRERKRVHFPEAAHHAYLHFAEAAY